MMEELLYETVCYLIFRRADKYGFIKFSYFKRIIQHLTGSNDIYLIRKIFIRLVDEGFFHRIRNIKRSYLYKFIGS